MSVRISYRRALDALGRYLRAINVPDPDARAHTILEPLLTDHQKEAMRG